MSTSEEIRNEDSPDGDDDQSTGLPWPKTWNGAYVVVIINFVFWLAMLITLGEIF